MERPERLERSGPSWLLKPEANRDSWSPYERGFWLVQWSCRAGTRDFCLALVAVVSPVQTIFFSPYTMSFHFICPRGQSTMYTLCPLLTVRFHPTLHPPLPMSVS
jgi:hypothetical protein